MIKIPKFLMDRDDLKHLFAKLGRRIKQDESATDQPGLMSRYRESGQWLRDDSTAKEHAAWYKLSRVAYAEAIDSGKTPTQARLTAKAEVQKTYPDISERHIRRVINSYK